MANNNKPLVIVESPTKAKTIRKFLPSNYQVEASMGHVRDLPASAAEIPKDYKDKPWARFGVDVENNFAPLYIVPPGKKKYVNQLKQALKSASEIYIATDEDREGESIGWHLLEVLKPKVPVKRMVFHEITEQAIKDALKNTRQINKDLVDAQETRRVLDRLVGYSISPLLWKKIAPKLSAGRVQSVAVRLLVLREKERLAFIAANYWDLKSKLAKNNKVFEAALTHLNDIRLANGKDFDPDTGKLRSKLTLGKDVLLLSKEKAAELATKLKDESWQVTKIAERQAKRSPAAPFTTSTLQQESSRKLGLSARETMRVAQKLYENGYITYMRTDSTQLSKEAITASREAVERLYGKNYLSPSPRQFVSKAKNAQEAHEAIRPAGTEMKTSSQHGLSDVEGKLYELIWKRTVASQMADARLRFVTATIEVTKDDKATFRASGSTIEFAGFFRAYVEGSDDPEAALDNREQPLPQLQEGERVTCNDLNAIEHETKPPARYTEASLVKLLEQEGIGRPSTYASIIDTIIRRGYVRKSGPALLPTFTAFATNNLLEAQFNQLVNVGFTAGMEQVLDDIASGSKEPIPYLQSFYKGKEGIEGKVEEGGASIDARAISTIISAKWEPYLIRVGRYGPYVEGILDGEEARAGIPENLAPADVAKEQLEQLLKDGSASGTIIGLYPETKEPMVLKNGPYGPYVQLGESDEGKPKRMSLPKGMMSAEVTESIAIDLLSLPRIIGQHPETGKEITASIGRFGPYVKHGSTFASLKKEDNLLTINFQRALELIVEKELKNTPLKILGVHPGTGEEIPILKGRFGPYVKHKRTNVSLPKGQNIESFDLKAALALLATKETSKTTGKKTTKGKSTKKGKTTSKKKESAKPKATTQDLEPFLKLLSEQDAKVVARIEGMNGFAKQDISNIIKDLGLSEEAIKAAHKRGMFKLRMEFGKARKQKEAA